MLECAAETMKSVIDHFGEDVENLEDLTDSLPAADYGEHQPDIFRLAVPVLRKNAAVVTRTGSR